MGKIALMISLDMLRFKVEKALRQFGISEIQTIGAKIVALTSKNFTYNDIELIIIDVDSPDFNAYEVIANLKKGIKSALLPILAIGNRSDASIATQLKTLGCEDYIPKPIDDMILSSKVLQLLRERKPNTEIKTHIEEKSKLETLKLAWHAEFETGIQAIDEEHHEIIKQYQKLYALMKDGLGHDFYEDFLTFLSSYVISHFENEERIQQEIGYPQMDVHKHSHSEFKEKLASFIQDKKVPPSNQDLLKINLFVKDWLIHHIYVEDRKIGAYYKSQK